MKHIESSDINPQTYSELIFEKGAKAIQWKKDSLFNKYAGITENSHVKNEYRGFPSGAVVENLPANAGDTGSISGPGRSHMPQSNYAREPQLLSLCATTTEAREPRACAPQQEKPP